MGLKRPLGGWEVVGWKCDDHCLCVLWARDVNGPVVLRLLSAIACVERMPCLSFDRFDAAAAQEYSTERTPPSL